ncbi:MAG: hypothetical protein RR427_02505 [Cellulosilyticaceae bacterium]
MDLEQSISCICDNNYEEMLQKKNVVGIFLGKKITGGIETDELCLKVLVTKKVDSNYLSSQDLVPSHYQGVTTDIVESGFIQASSLVSYVRPMLFGYSVGPQNLYLAGTAGALVTDGTTQYILSNNHVLAGENTEPLHTPILQPAVLDGGVPANSIASLSRFITISFVTATFTPVNYVDAAIAAIPNPSQVSKNIALIGAVTGTTNAVLGMPLKKAGRTTELTTGIVTGVNGTVSVGYSGGKRAIFRNQIMSTAMSSAGDSGSLVLTGNNVAVGLLFAGSASTTIFNPINRVLTTLGVRLVI